MSLLNMATELMWPEISNQDVMDLSKSLAPGTQLSKETADIYWNCVGNILD